MMHQTEKFRFHQDPGSAVQILEMPYKGQKSSMVFVLPKDASALKELESKLTSEQLQAWIGKLTETKVEVALPRFKVRFDLALSDTLKAMGMKQAFNPGAANFSGMVDMGMNSTPELYISEVFHEAFVQVNEEGAEAAAATGVVMAVRAMPTHPRFIANRPFLFAIRDTTSSQILFLGRVANPTVE